MCLRRISWLAVLLFFSLGTSATTATNAARAVAGARWRYRYTASVHVGALDSSMSDVGTVTAEALILVLDTPKSQDSNTICELRLGAAALSGKALDTTEDEPVYFEWAADGAIGRVLHPRDADLPTLNVKRGILSALQHSLAPPPTHAPGTETWEVDEEDVYGAGTPEQTVPTPFESRRAATTPSSPDRTERFARTRLQSITIQAPRSTWIREPCFRPSLSFTRRIPWAPWTRGLLGCART